MDAGKLTERITIKRDALADDGYGGSVLTESDVLTCWAGVRPLSGRERDMASQTESPRNYRFTLRRNNATSGILASDKISWRGRVFNIRFIADAGAMPLFLEIDAEDGVAA
jgi:SPP1 family predicted phage head-tail adaptor